MWGSPAGRVQSGKVNQRGMKMLGKEQKATFQA